jgi:uncharacterized protein
MNATAPVDSSLEWADRLQRLSKKAPRGEVRLYPGGHFDIYVGDDFERVVADQIDFLHRQVPVQG